MWNVWKYWRAVEIIKRMPVHYQRYLYELQNKPPDPVHFIPRVQTLTRDIETGEIKRFENRPISLIFPKECNDGLWGGEAIIKGYTKKKPKVAKFPHWWVPVLKRSVVYSEILDKSFVTVVTDRTLQLIDEAYGLDYYILKTHPVNLRSQLAMDLKRKMILTLIKREMYPDNPTKQEEVYQKYKEFIVPEEEAEWCGLSLIEAIKKQLQIEEEANRPVPLKIKYRAELLEMLKAPKNELDSTDDEPKSASWLSKLNPFATKHTSAPS